VRDGDDCGDQRLEFLSSNAQKRRHLIVMVGDETPEVRAYQGMSMFLVPADQGVSTSSAMWGCTGELDNEGSLR